MLRTRPRARRSLETSGRSALRATSFLSDEMVKGARSERQTASRAGGIGQPGRDEPVDQGAGRRRTGRGRNKALGASPQRLGRQVLGSSSEARGFALSACKGPPRGVVWGRGRRPYAAHTP